MILQIVSYTTSLTCWQGSSQTYSSSVEAKYGNVCVRYNYCSSGWNGSTCSVASVVNYGQLSPTDANNIAKSRDIIKCGTDYCNTLINPRTICYYGSSLNTYRREFDLDSKSCYSYMYKCTVVNDYCLSSDIGRYRIAYGISNSTTCNGVNDLVKCCQTSYCTRSLVYTTSLACSMYQSMKVITMLLLMYLIYT